MNAFPIRLGGNNPARPPVHPIAWHAGPVQESLRISEILSMLIIQTGAALANWRKRREDRAAFQHLMALDDAMLDDIGITRSDVIQANSLPLSVNAAAELEIKARSARRS